MNGVTQLQTAIYNALRTFAPLTSKLGAYGGQPAIFDGPLQAVDSADGTPFPMISFGYVGTVPDDTDTERGTQATITIHTWAETHAMSVISAIMAEVYECLHRQELAVSGYAFVGCDQTFSETTRDPDGVTTHGIQRFLISYEEA
jgi:hypothetical protein